MKKTLYLHIGTGKTGTTALQNMFFTNRKWFGKRGICYPDIGLYTIAHQPFGAALNEAKQAIFAYEKIETYVHEMLKLDRDVLISSENLFPASQDKIKKLDVLLNKFHVKVIVYLRRQDNYIMSLYNHMAKSHRVLDDDINHFIEQRNEEMQYDIALERWSSVLGKTNLIVRPYEKGQFYRGTIFADFLHYVFGMELSDGIKLPDQDLNPRFSRDMLEYKLLVRQLPLAGADINAFNRPLLLLSSQKDPGTAMAFSEHMMLSCKQRCDLITRYESNNRRIAFDYLNRADGILFYDALPDPKAAPDVCSGFSIKKITEITRLIADNFPKLIPKLRQGTAQGIEASSTSTRYAALLLQAALEALGSHPEPDIAVYAERTGPEKEAVDRYLHTGARYEMADKISDDVYQNYLISGKNSGNLLIGRAVRELCGTSDYAHFFVPLTEKQIEKFQHTYKKIVIAASNFLNEYADFGVFAENLEKLSLPVVAFGLGAQAKSFNDDIVARLKPGTVRFAKVVSELSAQIGVRGEYSASILNKLGIENVSIIGCPSCYLSRDPNYKIVKKPFREDFSVAVNFMQRSKNPINSFLVKKAIEQQFDMIGQMEWGLDVLKQQGFAYDKYEHLESELAFYRDFIDLNLLAEYAKSHFYQFYDVPQWLAHMKKYDFVMGCRFHGAMAAVQAGVPALVLTHDSRTHELCEYLNLPFIHDKESVQNAPLQQLYELADYDKFNSQYPQKYKSFVEFLKVNGFAADSVEKSPQDLPRLCYEFAGKLRFTDSLKRKMKSLLRTFYEASPSKLRPLLLSLGKAIFR